MPKPGDIVYVMMGAGVYSRGSMEDIYINTYEYKRETPTRWYVHCRGREKWFDKDNRSVYFDLEKLKKRLRDMKANRLESARRAVAALDCEQSVSFHPVCRDEPGDRILSAEDYKI